MAKHIMLPDENEVKPGTPEDYSVSPYSDIPPELPSPLFGRYIYTSAINVISGPPGVGKSSVAVDIGTIAALGKAFPDGSIYPEKIKVIYQVTEVGKIGIVTTILNNAGAPDQAFLRINGSDLTLVDERVKRALDDTGAKLLIFDPMQQFFEGDMNRGSHVRRELDILTNYAVNYDCAVILIGHFAKNSPEEILYQGLGSAEIAAVPRSILHVLPAEEGSPIRILKQVKNSYGMLEPSLAFEFLDLGKINWIGPVEGLDDVYLEKLLSESESGGSPKLCSAIIDMYKILKERDVPSNELFPMMYQHGHKHGTIARARTELDVDALKGERWLAHLDDAVDLESVLERVRTEKSRQRRKKKKKK